MTQDPNLLLVLLGTISAVAAAASAYWSRVEINESRRIRKHQRRMPKSVVKELKRQNGTSNGNGTSADVH